MFFLIKGYYLKFENSKKTGKICQGGIPLCQEGPEFLESPAPGRPHILDNYSIFSYSYTLVSESVN